MRFILCYVNILCALSMQTSHVGGFSTHRSFSFLLRNHQHKNVVRLAYEKIEPTFHTALCIVPPEELWDSIQRARYQARDSSFRKWPPAIRLFHPFCPRTHLEDAALEVATLVEKYKIRPFKVILSSIAIIPNLEAIEAEMEASLSLPSQDIIDEDENQAKADREFEQLIRKEEIIGKIRFERRRSQMLSEGKDLSEGFPSTERRVSPKNSMKRQKQMYEEFNGPCMVCLEPDPKSFETIKELRDLLAKNIFQAYEKFSPSSSITVTDSLPKSVILGDSTFRPLLPIAGFTSVSSAVKFARKLKGTWTPLSFYVPDLHFLSDIPDFDDFEKRDDQSRENIVTKLTSKDPTEIDYSWQSQQFGCDAAVMLLGEEIEQDEEVNEIMMDLLLQEGTPGAGDPSPLTFDKNEQNSKLDSVSRIPTDLNSESDLLAWLNDDEDLDEGTTVVIGRTHFFSGEMRSYER
jgi:hypothetical protein